MENRNLDFETWIVKEMNRLREDAARCRRDGVPVPPFTSGAIGFLELAWHKYWEFAPGKPLTNGALYTEGL